MVKPDSFSNKIIYIKSKMGIAHHDLRKLIPRKKDKYDTNKRICG